MSIDEDGIDLTLYELADEHVEVIEEYHARCTCGCEDFYAPRTATGPRSWGRARSVRRPMYVARCASCSQAWEIYQSGEEVGMEETTDAPAFAPAQRATASTVR